MNFLGRILLFIRNDYKKLCRKWKSLPLLLLYPIVCILLIAILAITFFSPAEDKPIQLGLIDLDKSEETLLIVNLLEQSAELSSFIQIHQLTEREALQKMKLNKISSYITLPVAFTENLYEGEKVVIEIVGNSEDKIESLLINEFVQSITRQIRTSQANILTINEYAKKMKIPADEKNDLLFEQFTEFFLYTIDKDRLLHENQLTNFATSTPLYYFAIGSWLVVITVWLLIFYLILHNNEKTILTQRLSLYGVLHIQRALARIFATLSVTALWSIGLFYCLQMFLPFNLYPEDYLRITLIMVLYSLFYLFLLTSIELGFKSNRTRLFVQVVFTAGSIILSGAILPSMYIPLLIQPILPYVYSNRVFYQLQEILLNDRLFIEYTSLLLMNGSVFLLLVGFSLWKEKKSCFKMS